jgi:hypothetical protein
MNPTELPREIRQAVHQMMRRRTGNGLSEDQLRERLDKLKELHILPEHSGSPDYYAFVTINRLWEASKGKCFERRSYQFFRPPTGGESLPADVKNWSASLCFGRSFGC